MILGGKYLILCDDSGANGLNIRRDMKDIYFNSNSKRVSIEIARDHQLTGNRLCTSVTVANPNIGWINLIWCQSAQVKSQNNSILSIFQMRHHGCLVSNPCKRQ